MNETTKSAVLVGATVAFMIAVGNLYWQVDRVRTDVVTLRQSIVSELAKLRVTAPTPEKPVRRESDVNLRALESLKNEIEQELNAAKSQVGSAARVAKTEAVKHADELVRRLGEEHQNQHKEVTGELGQVRQGTATANARIDTVTAEVSQIRNQVASTQQELEQTVADLKRVTGDLGVQSGYVATNARELAALKALGERNYYDFHLQKTKQPQRVGEVTVLLKKTDPKTNKYTLEVIAGDKRTEKRDKGVNEALQFYTSKARMPSEIVVNEVQKDYVIGYLSTPKAQVALTSKLD